MLSELSLLWCHQFHLNIVIYTATVPMYQVINKLTLITMVYKVIVFFHSYFVSLNVVTVSDVPQ